VRSSKVVDVVTSGAGLAAVVLLVSGVILGDTADQASNPNPTQSADLLADALTRNRDDARLGAYLLLPAALLLLLFIGRLASYLSQPRMESEWMSFTVLAGGAVFAGMVLVDAGFAFAVTELTTFGNDPAVAKTLFLWGWNSAFLYAAPLTAIAAGTTITAIAQTLFPAWARWASLVLVVIMLVGFLLGVPGMATGVGLLWMALMSILLTVIMLVRGTSDSSHSVVTPPGPGG
jgi:hypothetical protein